MNKNLKKLIIGTLVLSGFGLGSMVTFAMSPANSPYARETIMVCRMMPQKHHRHSMHRFNHKLTATDAAILAKAHLIKVGEKNLHVGKIISKEFHGHKGYIINITTKDGSLVRQIFMNTKTARVHLIPQV